MDAEALTSSLVEQLAERFKVLSEPARLAILQSLRSGELCVSEIAERSGLAQANTSKHLRLLRSAGFVGSRRDGLRVLYSLESDEVFQLCEISCGRLEEEWERRSRVLKFS